MNKFLIRKYKNAISNLKYTTLSKLLRTISFQWSKVYKKDIYYCSGVCKQFSVLNGNPCHKYWLCPFCRLLFILQLYQEFGKKLNTNLTLHIKVFENPFGIGSDPQILRKEAIKFFRKNKKNFEFCKLITIVDYDTKLELPILRTVMIGISNLSSIRLMNAYKFTDRNLAKQIIVLFKYSKIALKYFSKNADYSRVILQKLGNTTRTLFYRKENINAIYNNLRRPSSKTENMDKI